jgi:hypothetical protein
MTLQDLEFQLLALSASKKVKVTRLATAFVPIILCVYKAFVGNPVYIRQWVEDELKTRASDLETSLT